MIVQLENCILSYQRNEELSQRVIALGDDAKVLDVGGWYACYPLATHVVDIMPYDTRGQGYFPKPRPGERFTRETWMEADITAPNFRLPHPDKFFAFAICMNTLEDLHEIRPLVRELTRVAMAGYLETPAHLMEQTVGIVDRACSQVGFNHHKWIVDADGSRLALHDKAESFYQPKKYYAIPLSFYESCGLSKTVQYYWENSITLSVCQDWKKSRRMARDFKERLNIPRWEELKDLGLRAARSARNAARGISRFSDA
jgi:hypothetical protein